MLCRMFAPLGRLLDFGGRMRRRDFWAYMLLLLLIYVVGFFVLVAGADRGWGSPVPYMFALIGLIALLAYAAAVRRMHDAGWRGAWVTTYVLATLSFLGLYFYARGVAVAGDHGILFRLWPIIMPLTLLQNGIGLLILVVCTLDGTAGANRYGPNPRHDDDEVSPWPPIQPPTR